MSSVPARAGQRRRRAAKAFSPEDNSGDQPDAAAPAPTRKRGRSNPNEDAPVAEEPARERECRASPNAAAEDDDVDEVVVQVPLKKRVARDAKRAGATATTAKAAAKAKAAATNADEDAAGVAPPAAADEDKEEVPGAQETSFQRAVRDPSCQTAVRVLGHLGGGGVHYEVELDDGEIVYLLLKRSGSQTAPDSELASRAAWVCFSSSRFAFCKT